MRFVPGSYANMYLPYALTVRRLRLCANRIVQDSMCASTRPVAKVFPAFEHHPIPTEPLMRGVQVNGRVRVQLENEIVYAKNRCRSFGEATLRGALPQWRNRRVLSHAVFQTGPKSCAQRDEPIACPTAEVRRRP